MATRTNKDIILNDSDGTRLYPLAHRDNNGDIIEDTYLKNLKVGQYIKLYNSDGTESGHELKADDLVFYSTEGTNNGLMTISGTSAVATNTLIGGISTGGADVVTILGIDYREGDSAITPPSSGWQTGEIPTVAPGKYLWTRTRYSNGNNAYSVSRQAIDGTNGTDGTDGRDGTDGTSVTISDIKYRVYNSGTEHPPVESELWQPNIPVVGLGQYLWTRVHYSDGDYSYSVAYQGTNGLPGSSPELIEITPSVEFLIKNSSGTSLQPSSVTFTNSKTVGNSTSSYSGRIKIEISTDGSTWNTVGTYGTSSNPINYYTYTPQSQDISNLKYIKGSVMSPSSDTVIDYQTVAVVRDGKDGNNGTNGTNGQSVWIRYSNDIVNKVFLDPSATTGKYIGVARRATNPGNVWDAYNWTQITGTNGQTPTITGTEIKYIQTDSNSPIPGPSAGWLDSPPQAVPNKYMWTRTTITFSVGDPVVTYMVSKNGPAGNDGKGISSVDEWYAATSDGTNPPPIESSESSENVWVKNSIPTLDATNKYLWNYEEITYTDNTKDTTDPAVIGVFGVDGRTIVSITEYYQINNSTATPTPVSPYTGWSTTPSIPTESNPYLWNFEVVEMNPGPNYVSIPAIIGTFSKSGTDGRSMDDVTDYYQASSSTSENDLDPTKWVTSISLLDPPFNETNKYLWNYELIDYNNGPDTETSKRIIGVYGQTGGAGKGISGIIEYYLKSSQSSGITRSTSGWSTSIPTLDNTDRYLWNYEEITYTDGSTSYKSDPVIIGYYSENGLPGSQIWSASSAPTTESGKYKFNKSNLTGDSSATPKVGDLIFQGSYRYSITEVTDNYVYSTTRENLKGDPGQDATSPTAYSLYIEPSAIIRDTNNSNSLSPRTISASAKSQTGDGNLGNYSGRFKIEYTSDTSASPIVWNSIETSGDVSSYSYTIPTSGNIFGAQAFRVSLYKYGGTSVLLDQQTIPVINTGTDGTPGSPGNDGAPAYTAWLTNENHTFAADKGGNPITAGNANVTTTTAIVYKGGTQQTISSITIKGGSAPSGLTINTSSPPNITITADSGIAASGKVTFTVTADSKTFDVDFSYSISKTGADGQGGAAGFNFATVTLYKRSSSQPTIPNTTLTYKFSDESLTPTDSDATTYLGGWSRTMPSGSDPCWVIIANVSSQSATDTITSGEWNGNGTPVKLVQDGTNGRPGSDGNDGNPGYNQATIFLYRRSSTALTDSDRPSDDTYYKFSTGVLSLSSGGSAATTVATNWTRNVPAGPDPCWVTTAAAISQESQIKITKTTGWSTPIKFVQDGEDGDAGVGYTVMLLNESKQFASGPVHPTENQTYTVEILTLKNTSKIASIVGYSSSYTSGSTQSCIVSPANNGVSVTAVSNGTTSANGSFTIQVTTSTTQDGTITVPVKVEDQIFDLVFNYSLNRMGTSVSASEPLWYLKDTLLDIDIKGNDVTQLGSDGKNKAALPTSYSGTATDKYYIDFCTSINNLTKYNLTAGTTYTFSVYVYDATTPFNISVGAGSGTYAKDISSVVCNATGRVSLTFTPTSDQLSSGRTFAFRAPRYSDSTSFSYRVEKAQLEIGSTATTYTPMLSPLRPQRIHASRSKNTILINGKNLLKPTLLEPASNYEVTLTPNGNGIYTSSGTATGGNAAITTGYATLPPGNYFLSGCPSGGSSSTWRLRLYDVTNSAGLGWDYGSGLLFRLTSTTQVRTTFYAYSGTNVSNKIISPMICTNLFDTNDASTLNATVNYTNMNLTSSSNAKTLYIPCLSDTTYTIIKKSSKRFVLGTTATTPSLNVAIMDYTIDNDATSLTIKTSSTAKYLCVYYYLSGTDTLTESEIRNSIVITKEDFTYQPYQEKEYDISLPVRNLLDADKLITTNRVFNKNGTNDYTFKKVSTSSRMTTWAYCPLSQGFKVTFSMKSSGQFSSGITLRTGNSGSTVQGVALTYADGYYKGSLNLTANTNYIQLYFANNSTGVGESFAISDVQLEIGTVVSKYNPYGNDFIELYKIGTYQDYLYKNNDRWYVHKAISSVDLGTLTWSYYTNSTPYFMYNTSLGVVSGTTDTLCEKYPPSPVPTTEKTYRFNGQILRIYDEDYTDPAVFKTDMSGCMLLYPRETPQEIEIADVDLAKQLNDLYKATSYDGVTNVLQIYNSDLPLIINYDETATQIPLRPTSEVTTKSNLPEVWSLSPADYIEGYRYYITQQTHYNDGTVGWSDVVSSESNYAFNQYKEIIPLYYLGLADEGTPLPPINDGADVGSVDDTGVWTTLVPTYRKPQLTYDENDNPVWSNIYYYWTCQRIRYSNDTYSLSDVVLDSALNNLSFSVVVNESNISRNSEMINLKVSSTEYNMRLYGTPDAPGVTANNITQKLSDVTQTANQISSYVGTISEGETLAGKLSDIEESILTQTSTDITAQFTKITSSPGSGEPVTIGGAITLDLVTENNKSYTRITLGNTSSNIQGVFTNTALNFQTTDSTPIKLAWIDGEQQEFGASKISIGTAGSNVARWRISPTGTDGKHLTFTRHA